MSFLTASSPILLLLVLLLVMRAPLFVAAPLGFLYTAAIAVAWWALSPIQVISSAAKALLLSADIMLIIFGAIFFLGFLKRDGTIRLLESQLAAITADRRLQAILLAWLFGSFIEGASGFGTPAAVIAPLMVGIGFPPLTAISVCLIANSTAVAFGAVGTPLRIGFEGLNIAGVPERAALINAIVGMSVPLMILAVIVRTEAQDRLKRFLEAVPWALFAGAAFLVPHLLVSLLGYEFPSILGAATGLGLALISLKFGFLVPARTFEFSTNVNSGVRVPPQKLGGAVFPYLLLLALLLLGKFVFSNFSARIEVGGGLTHTLHLFNPGFAFLTVVAVLALSGARKRKLFINLFRTTLEPLGKTAASIFFIAATTYLMVSTGTLAEKGMLDALASPLHSAALPAVSVFLGAFGSFIAGSATVSNLMFGSLQVQAAESMGYATAWILALQLVGAGAGNMIALPNVLAVQATVGLRDQEAALIWRLIPACALYLCLAAVVGLLMVR